MNGLIAILTFLAFAVVFYILMRTGFGWDVVHGARMSARRDPEAIPVPEDAGPDVDPVCGMRVAPGDGPEITYDGVTYCFCSRNCLRRFESSPSSFTGLRSGGNEQTEDPQ